MRHVWRFLLSLLMIPVFIVLWLGDRLFGWKP